MFRCKQAFKRFLLGGGAVCAARCPPSEPVICGSPEYNDNCRKLTRKPERFERYCRASELPIYCPTETNECKMPGIQKSFSQKPDRGTIEESIGKARKELWVWYDQFKGYSDKVVEVSREGRSRSQTMLEYLKVEENYLPRAGAIGLSGVAGLIFGLRGGWFKRITYASLGSASMSALCYPRQSAELSHEALGVVKKYVTIGYNFIYGVKPSEQPALTNEFGTTPPTESKSDDIQNKDEKGTFVIDPYAPKIEIFKK